MSALSVIETPGKSDPPTFVPLQWKGVLVAKNMSVVCVLKTKMVYLCYFMFAEQKPARHKVQ